MMMLVPAHSGSVVPGLPAHEGGAPASPRVVCRSGGKVDALPIVESSWRSDTHPMSNDATPTLGGFGSGPSEVSVNQRGYPTVNGVDGAGWRRPSPVAVAQWSSRRRRVVFSLLAGVRLAAGGGGSHPAGLGDRGGAAFIAAGAVGQRIMEQFQPVSVDFHHSLGCGSGAASPQVAGWWHCWVRGRRIGYCLYPAVPLHHSRWNSRQNRARGRYRP